MGDQRHRQVAAVDVLVEVEEMRLERRTLIAEHRLAVARDAIDQPAVDQTADDIDALREPEAGRLSEVGGGKTELAAAPVAGHHLALDEPVVAEEPIGLFELPCPERRPDARRGNGIAALDDEIQHFDGAAMPGHRLAQEVGRAAAIAAEMKILPDDDSRSGKTIDQEAGNEILCLDVGEGSVKRQDDDAVETQGLGETCLGIAAGKAEHEGLRRQNVTRMRLEGDDDGGLAAFPGARREGGEHRLVPAVEAVEIADGNDAAPKPIGNRV